MLNIVDRGIDYIMKQLKSKKLVIFGCGKIARSIYYTWDLKQRITYFVDNNTNITSFKTEFETIPVIGLKEFIDCVDKENTILLISPIYAAPEIIDQLDQIEMLDGLECYVARMVDEYYEPQKFEFTVGAQKIPKKIHYCWFGNNEKPDIIKKCIESWYKHCPNYEITEWNESNYDVNKNRYMKEAYENKRWGFVPDYARLDIVYEEGGIYLDTDVELLKAPDMLLNDEMYCGSFSEYVSDLGLGFGARRHHPLIRMMRDYYDDKTFYNEDGSLNLSACNFYQDPVLMEYGFDLRNKYQKINGVVYYPTEVLNPKGMSGVSKNFTYKTVSVHYGTVSWLTQKEKDALERYRRKMKIRYKK